MAVEMTDGTLKGKVVPTINPEVEEIPITVNNTYVNYGSAVKIGKIVFVALTLNKTKGGIDSLNAEAMISGLPPARANNSIHTLISAGGHTVRVVITTKGELKEHWTLTWTQTSGDELEATLIYVSK